MDTQFVTDPVEGGADPFFGCYFPSKPIEANVMCHETLIMDDTSCTNGYALPRLVVLAIDENLSSQLVAVAFLRDRATESFSHFLTWMRDHVTNREIDPATLFLTQWWSTVMMINTPRFKACSHDLESFSAPNTSAPTFGGRWDVTHGTIAAIGE
jgi:hypothetical protein